MSPYFCFAGQYFDSETGLHYNYFRYYDPATGRYITSDPIGLGGGLNNYVYSRNNPTIYFDFYGLKEENWNAEEGNTIEQFPKPGLDYMDSSNFNQPTSTVIGQYYDDGGDDGGRYDESGDVEIKVKCECGPLTVKIDYSFTGAWFDFTPDYAKYYRQYWDPEDICQQYGK